MADTDSGENDTESVGGALLTATQRDWLAAGAPEPFENPNHRNYRTRIIKRVQQAMKDFELLPNLPDGDHDRIYEDFAGWPDGLVFLFRPQIRAILDTPTGMRTIRSSETDAQTIPSDELQDYFGSQLAHAISQALDAEGATGYTVDVDVDIEPLNVSTVDGAIEKLAAGARYQDLDRHELAQYVRLAERAGSVDLEAVVRERQQERDELAAEAQDAANNLSEDDFPPPGGYTDGPTGDETDE